MRWRNVGTRHEAGLQVMAFMHRCVTFIRSDTGHVHILFKQASHGSDPLVVHVIDGGPRETPQSPIISQSTSPLESYIAVLDYDGVELDEDGAEEGGYLAVCSSEPVSILPRSKAPMHMGFEVRWWRRFLFFVLVCLHHCSQVLRNIGKQHCPKLSNVERRVTALYPYPRVAHFATSSSQSLKSFRSVAARLCTIALLRASELIGCSTRVCAQQSEINKTSLWRANAFIYNGSQISPMALQLFLYCFQHKLQHFKC